MQEHVIKKEFWNRYMYACNQVQPCWNEIKTQLNYPRHAQNKKLKVQLSAYAKKTKLVYDGCKIVVLS